MDRARTFEKLVVSIASLGKSEVARRIKNFKGSFKFDFTDEYLDGLTIEKLRHILLAAITSRLDRKSN